MSRKNKGEPQKRGKIKFRQAVQIVRADGWVKTKSVNKNGTSHFHYEHPTKKGTIVLSKHGGKDLPQYMVDNMYDMINETSTYRKH